MEKVVAVVVTYNRLALLSECLTALRNQTRKPDSILVINNGSTDGTEDWLRSQPDIDYFTQPNVGGAGGFRTAIQQGYQKGFNWVWCMDDDGQPKEDALENLLAAETNELTLLNCAVINIEDKKSFVWKTGNYKTIDEVDTNLIKGIGHPFNGTLINRKIIERVGVPRSEFFLWGDETEYFYRITKTNNIPVCTVANSIHYHPATAFSLKQNWDFASSWKLYYYVRNRFHVYKTRFNNKALAFAGYCCFLVAFAGIVLLFQKSNKLKKLSFIAWPLADAFKNNFDATPSTILSGLKSRSTYSFSNTVNNYLKNIGGAIAAPFMPRPRSAANA
jgi:rhamnopyranosyl-N-acetylglucosaminyl-diphospho-decaprenol beta-1,3/1,4-galactofuranosyltransferase